MLREILSKWSLNPHGLFSINKFCSKLVVNQSVSKSIIYNGASL